MVKGLKTDLGNWLKEEYHQMWKLGLELEMVEAKVDELLELLLWTYEQTKKMKDVGPTG